MKLELNLDTVDGYRQFLKVKSLPSYSFVGRVAHFPDEYAGFVGVTAPRLTVDVKPSPKLFDYQRDIAALAIRKHKFAVFADCGLGKSLIDFEFARAALAATGGRVLIVAPLMVVRQMLGEFEKFYPGERPIDRIKADGLQAWLAQPGGVIGATNYEAIRPGLDRGNLSALLLSESSMLKSHYGAWGARLIELGRGLNWKLCETGTPAPNDRIEYANHAVFLDQFPTVNSFLARFFVNRGETGERWELKPHALRPFYRALSHWCIFLSNPAVYGWKDNCKPLPPIRTHIIDVEMTDDQKEVVRAETGGLFGDTFTPGGIGSRSKFSRIGKGIGAGGVKLATRKPEVVARLAGEAPSLVWCKFNAEQDELARLMPDAASIDGKTDEDDRAEMVAAFQSGATNTLITKPKILGFGLNLQQAHRQVFSTVQDSYEEYYQAVKRSNRTGSTRPLDVFIPVTDVERPMLETVLAKAARVQADTEEQERLFKEVGHVDL